LNAIQALSQLSYSPKQVERFIAKAFAAVNRKRRDKKSKIIKNKLKKISWDTVKNPVAGRPIDMDIHRVDHD
jgi:hypothetical protein